VLSAWSARIIALIAPKRKVKPLFQAETAFKAGKLTIDDGKKVARIRFGLQNHTYPIGVELVMAFVHGLAAAWIARFRWKTAPRRLIYWNSLVAGFRASFRPLVGVS
jgi:hypothetical protein